MYASKLYNLAEMDKFLEKHKLLKLTQKETENLNRPEISKEIELAIKTHPPKKCSGPNGFTGEFYQTFKNI